MIHIRTAPFPIETSQFMGTFEAIDWAFWASCLSLILEPFEA